MFQTISLSLFVRRHQKILRYKNGVFNNEMYTLNQSLYITITNFFQ